MNDLVSNLITNKTETFVLKYTENGNPFIGDVTYAVCNRLQSDLKGRYWIIYDFFLVERNCLLFVPSVDSTSPLCFRSKNSCTTTRGACWWPPSFSTRRRAKRRRHSSGSSSNAGPTHTPPSAPTRTTSPPSCSRSDFINCAPRASFECPVRLPSIRVKSSVSPDSAKLRTPLDMVAWVHRRSHPSHFKRICLSKSILREKPF